MTKTFNIKANKPLRSALRSHMTEPEKRLWRCIRAHQLGVKFRRQHGIGNYIVDFYSPEIRLVIEVDGDSHFTREAQAYDQIRENFMSSLSIKTIRFTNEQAILELDAVLETILQAITPHETIPAAAKT